MELDTTNQQVTPAQNTTPEPIVNSPVSNQKGFIPIILGVIIILIVVAGGAYYLGSKNSSNSAKQLNQPPTVAPTTIPSVTTTPTSTSNLQSQTYTNSGQKISFEYPSDWAVKYKDTKYPMELCDLNKIIPSSVPNPGVRYGACEASGVTPTASLTFGELLDVRPQSALKESYYPNPAIQLNYYENPDNLTIQEFNNKYLSETVAGDPISIWSANYEKVTNDNGITAYYDKEHYCVAMCQVYVFSGKGKIFILKNFPTNAPNQLDIFKKVFSTFKFSN